MIAFLPVICLYIIARRSFKKQIVGGNSLITNGVLYFVNTDIVVYFNTDYDVCNKLLR